MVGSFGITHTEDIVLKACGLRFRLVNAIDAHMTCNLKLYLASKSYLPIKVISYVEAEGFVWLVLISIKDGNAKKS